MGTRTPRTGPGRWARAGRPDHRAAAGPLGAARRWCSTRAPGPRPRSARKAICQQRDVLDVWDAVGVGAEIAGRGRHLDDRAHLLPRPRAVRFTFVDRGRSPFPPFVNISQSRDRGSCSTSGSPAQPLIDVRWGHGSPGSSRTRRRDRDLRDARRVGDRRRVVRRGLLRRHGATRCAATLGLSFDGETLRRPVPHLRHPHRPARLGDRAAVLLRPGVEPGPPGAHPPLPRIPPSGSTGRCRPTSTSPPRRPPAASTGASAQIVGDRRLRARLEVGVPLPLPGGRPDAGRPGAARRRRRPPGLPVRRAGG